MISYSLLKTRSARKKLNAPFPTPTNKQSINPASLTVYATPRAVPTTIKIYMNHFSVVLISQFNTVTSIIVVTPPIGRMAYSMGYLIRVPRKAFEKKVRFL